MDYKESFWFWRNDPKEFRKKVNLLNVIEKKLFIKKKNKNKIRSEIEIVY